MAISSLVALSDRQQAEAPSDEHGLADGGAKQRHVMLSCEYTHWRLHYATRYPCLCVMACDGSRQYQPDRDHRLTQSGRVAGFLDDLCVCPDQWDHQATIKRVNESLIARGYLTWFDLTNMKGARPTVSLLVCLARALMHRTCCFNLCRQYSRCHERRDRPERSDALRR